MAEACIFPLYTKVTEQSFKLGNDIVIFDFWKKKKNCYGGVQNDIFGTENVEIPFRKPMPVEKWDEGLHKGSGNVVKEDGVNLSYN